MAREEEKKAEYCQEKKGVKELRRFTALIFAKSSERAITVKQRKQRLNYSCNPKEAHQACNKHKHLPGTYLRCSEVTLGIDDTYYKEDHKPQQLKQLQPRHIIYKFTFQWILQFVIPVR